MSAADQLRKFGLIVLITGLAIGGAIYFLAPPDDSSDGNTLLSQYHKNEEVESQRLWGAEGSLVLEITRSLKRPRTYSVIVICVSAFASFSCFFLAGHPGNPPDSAGKIGDS
jgi:hypothetical protein